MANQTSGRPLKRGQIQELLLGRHLLFLLGVWRNRDPPYACTPFWFRRTNHAPPGVSTLTGPDELDFAICPG